MSHRMALPAVTTSPELLRLLEEAKKLPPMTKAEIEVQRRSWVIGELMLEHDDMTREEAEALYDSVLPLTRNRG